jgi:hypothetical protein
MTVRHFFVLPVVVDVTSGRFYPFDFGRQQAQTIVLANL